MTSTTAINRFYWNTNWPFLLCCYCFIWFALQRHDELVSWQTIEHGEGLTLKLICQLKLLTSGQTHQCWVCFSFVLFSIYLLWVFPSSQRAAWGKMNIDRDTILSLCLLLSRHICVTVLPCPVPLFSCVFLLDLNLIAYDHWKDRICFSFFQSPAVCVSMLLLP